MQIKQTFAGVSIPFLEEEDQTVQAYSMWGWMSTAQHAVSGTP